MTYPYATIMRNGVLYAPKTPEKGTESPLLRLENGRLVEVPASDVFAKKEATK